MARTKDEETLRRAYDFFKEKADTKDHFTKDDVVAAVQWKRKSVGDYFSKKLKKWIVSHERGQSYSVAPEFSRLSFEQFFGHMSQVARATGYVRWVYDDVVQYEFLLPLTPSFTAPRLRRGSASEPARKSPPGVSAAGVARATSTSSIARF